MRFPGGESLNAELARLGFPPPARSCSRSDCRRQCSLTLTKTARLQTPSALRSSSRVRTTRACRCFPQWRSARSSSLPRSPGGRRRTMAGRHARIVRAAGPVCISRQCAARRRRHLPPRLRQAEMGARATCARTLLPGYSGCPTRKGSIHIANVENIPGGIKPQDAPSRCQRPHRPPRPPSHGRRAANRSPRARVTRLA